MAEELWSVQAALRDLWDWQHLWRVQPVEPRDCTASAASGYSVPAGHHRELHKSGTVRWLGSQAVDKDRVAERHLLAEAGHAALGGLVVETSALLPASCVDAAAG